MFRRRYDEVQDVLAERQAAVARAARRRRVHLRPDVVINGVVARLAEHDKREYESEAAETHDNRPEVREADNGHLLVA